jgi:hypothetical protein
MTSAASSKTAEAESAKTLPKVSIQTGQTQTSLGWSLFGGSEEGTQTPSGIRQRLEIKYCACLVLGGHNRRPLDPERIHNPQLKTLAGAAMTLRDFTIQDLTQCTGRLGEVAGSVLLATLERPVWNDDDLRLMAVLEQLEALQRRAMRGGKTL